MQIGQVVRSRKLKGEAIVIAKNKNELLVECKDLNDGRFVVSAFAGYYAKDQRRRLRWIKKKDVESWT